MNIQDTWFANKFNYIDANLSNIDSNIIDKIYFLNEKLKENDDACIITGGIADKIASDSIKEYNLLKRNKFKDIDYIRFNIGKLFILKGYDCLNYYIVQNNYFISDSSIAEVFFSPDECKVYFSNRYLTTIQTGVLYSPYWSWQLSFEDAYKNYFERFEQIFYRMMSRNLLLSNDIIDFMNEQFNFLYDKNQEKLLQRCELISNKFNNNLYNIYKTRFSDKINKYWFCTKEI